MNNLNEETSVVGRISGLIEYKNGEKEEIKFKNTLLSTGREALAACLANRLNDQFDFYISAMMFGDNGTTTDGVPKYVAADRTALFGNPIVTKPVLQQIDEAVPTQALFVSVLPYNDPSNGYALSEMALRMENYNLYSMATFPNLTKTDQMQITWTWTVSFI